MPGGKKFRVETSNRHYASFINLLIKLYKCLQKPNRTVLIFLRIHMCTTFYAHTKFNIVLFIWTTNLIHLHLCVLCDGSILTLLFLLFWYHFHCMYLLQIYTRYEFVLYKLEQKKKKSIPTPQINYVSTLLQISCWKFQLWDVYGKK